MPTNRELVYKYLKEHGETKKIDLYQAMPFGYYYNWQKHFGDLLYRMVKRGWIVRTRPGYYKAVENPNHGFTNKKDPVDPDQTTLL